MDDTEALNVIEERLSRLEERVLPSSENQKQIKTAVCDVILKTNKEMKKVEVEKSSISQLWKKIHTLEEILKSDFMDNVIASDDVKTELVLAEEAVLRKTASKLEEIHKLKAELEKEDLKGVMSWTTKLEPLAHYQIEQKTEQEDIGQHLTVLLNIYNELISGLSKQFIEWDNVLTQCEVAFDSKKSSSD